MRRIKAVMDYCQSPGYRNVIVAEGFALPLPNPCEGIKAALPKNRVREQHRVALPYRDLPAFIERLRTCRASLTDKLALEFTILTSTRTVEVINARWEEFDSLVIEAGLAHRVRGIERHYLRTTFVDKRRQLMGA